MTELSALAGSEGYAACDDDGGLYCQKGRRVGLRYKCNKKEVTQGWRTPKMVFAHYQ